MSAPSSASAGASMACHSLSVSQRVAPASSAFRHSSPVSTSASPGLLARIAIHPSRQRTLLAALQWSYGLLSAAEQRLFRQLGAFVGGFTLELAIAMAREPDVDDGRIVAQLDGLVERSLIEREPGDPPRFRMLESQRALALQELAKLGEPLKLGRSTANERQSGSRASRGEGHGSPPFLQHRVQVPGHPGVPVRPGVAA